MKTVATSPAGTFTGRHMLLVTVAFFGVIIAVNITMATLSFRSWTGLAVQNSYVASQEFEEKRIAHEAQRAAGWQPVLTYADGRMALMVRDGRGEAVALGDVTLKVNRPVGGHDDQMHELSETGTGGYEAAINLGVGIWEVTFFAADTPLGPFEVRERLTVSDAAP